MHRNVKLTTTDGTELGTLRFTHTAFRFLEERTGLTPGEALDSIQRPTVLAALVFAGLTGFQRLENPSANVPEQRVAEILDQLEYSRAVAQVDAAVSLGWFDPTVPRDEPSDDDDEGKAPSPTAGDGAKPKPSDSG